MSARNEALREDALQQLAGNPDDALMLVHAATILTLTAERTEVEAEVLDGFIGFLGHGENSMGRFPTTLTELADATQEYRTAGCPREVPV